MKKKKSPTVMHDSDDSISMELEEDEREESSSESSSDESISRRLRPPAKKPSAPTRVLFSPDKDQHSVKSAVNQLQYNVKYPHDPEISMAGPLSSIIGQEEMKEYLLLGASQRKWPNIEAAEGHPRHTDGVCLSFKSAHASFV